MWLNENKYKKRLITKETKLKESFQKTSQALSIIGLRFYANRMGN